MHAAAKPPRSPSGHVYVIDSHTAGEPTRVVVAGGPDLGAGSLALRLEHMRSQHDRFRSSVVCEPRGSEALVGALLCTPSDPAHAAGVIFFNDVGYLGMCGHGTIGLVTTLAHLGRIAPGRHGIETPVGVVQATLHRDGSVTVENVPSYRYATQVAVTVPGVGVVKGDVAWGGNWFFLVNDPTPPIERSHVAQLTASAIALRTALAVSGVTGQGGAPIDHIEYCAPPRDPANHGSNFVLCPGASFDRSPCGTGTSAKLACLAADGLLSPGQVWLQEGVLGTVFAASYRVPPRGSARPDAVLPSITGTAYITAEAKLFFHAADPFAAGIHFAEPAEETPDRQQTAGRS